MGLPEQWSFLLSTGSNQEPLPYMKKTPRPVPLLWMLPIVVL